MNELANFNFTVHYKLGVQNPVADALNRYPLAEKYLREYSETCSVDEVKAKFDVAVYQSEKIETYMSVVNKVSATIGKIEIQLHYDGVEKPKTLRSKDLT